MTITGPKFLDTTLSGAATPADIDDLIRCRVREGLHHDFKRGGWLERGGDANDKKDAPARLRKWVSSFANAEGGVLIIGVAGGEQPQKPGDTQWCVDPCPPRPGKNPWYEWATSALRPLVPYCSPQPHSVSIQHTAGEVLVVAVNRSHLLVPCLEDGRHVHYLRVGDSTVQIDDYLYADLVLGRRQRPTFDARLDPAKVVSGANVPAEISVNLYIDNRSLVWAPDLHIGVLCYAAERPKLYHRDVGANTHGVMQVGPQLLQYVDVAPSPHTLFVSHTPATSITASPFSVNSAHLAFKIPTVDGIEVVCGDVCGAFKWTTGVVSDSNRLHERNGCPPHR